MAILKKETICIENLLQCCSLAMISDSCLHYSDTIRQNFSINKNYNVIKLFIQSITLYPLLS